MYCPHLLKEEVKQLSWIKKADSKVKINDNTILSTTETWSAKKINMSLDLNNLKGVDVTNKENNYALIYDETSEEFVSKPLPTSPVILESLTEDPNITQIGQMWLRSDL